MGLPQYLGEMEIWQETATKAEARTKQVRKHGIVVRRFRFMSRAISYLAEVQILQGEIKKNSWKILLATLKKNFNVRDDSKLDYHKALFGN